MPIQLSRGYIEQDSPVCVICGGVMIKVSGYFVCRNCARRKKDGKK